MASHAVESLAPLADQAIYLEDGHVAWSGPGRELLATSYMSHLRTASLPKLTKVEHAAPSDCSVGTEAERSPSGMDSRNTNKCGSNRDVQYTINEAPPKTPKQLIMDEQRAKGLIDGAHWWNLKRASGSDVFWICVLFTILLCRFLPFAELQSLKYVWEDKHVPLLTPLLFRFWTDDTNADSSHSGMFWLAVYSGVSGLYGIKGFITS